MKFRADPKRGRKGNAKSGEGEKEGLLGGRSFRDHPKGRGAASRSVLVNSGGKVHLFMFKDVEGRRLLGTRYDGESETNWKKGKKKRSSEGKG